MFSIFITIVIYGFINSIIRQIEIWHQDQGL